TGELLYANGGHNLPYLVPPGGQPRAVGAGHGGLVLGFTERADYPTERAALPPGGALVLYTDGVTEARDGRGDFFSAGRLEAVLRKASHGAAEEIVRGVVDAVRAFAAGTPQSDDVTALAVRFRGARGGAP